MAKKGHSVLSPMGIFGGSTMNSNNGKAGKEPSVKTIPDPLGLNTASKKGK